jgi:SAM-dependent methyltransferase
MADIPNLDVDAYFSFVQRNAFIPEPPKDRMFVGDGQFREIGCAIVKALIKTVGLRQKSALLDIGSGIGRVALPLTQWLDSTGRYVGIEIVAEGVSWCIENISAKYPNFRFIHADIRNDYYNPTGQGTSANFQLPGNPESFDVAVFASVFTHLDSADADAWLNHVSKALRPAGRVWSTWFSMDEEAIHNCRVGKSTIGLGYEEYGVFWQTPEKSPGAIGYAPWKMREMFERYGFSITSWTHGSWCHRAQEDGGYQDTVILEKPIRS